jgi:hypothetical protein
MCVNGHETIIAIIVSAFEWLSFLRNLGSPLQLKGKNSQAWVCFGCEQNKD